MKSRLERIGEILAQDQFVDVTKLSDDELHELVRSLTLLVFQQKHGHAPTEQELEAELARRSEAFGKMSLEELARLRRLRW